MRYIIRLFTVAWLAIAAFSTSPAIADKRMALVVGNSAYSVGPLESPVNDASAIAEAFQRKLGFDDVRLKTNLGADAFRMALLEFARDSAGADIGVVYFAGHGTESGGRNFLIPVDARLQRAGDLDLEAIALDTVLGQLSGVGKLKLVILDACRNSLFPLSGARRSASRGLARIEPEGNTLVAYAAKDGTTADDGTGRRHSPFTEALLKYVARPGLEIRQLFGYVRDEVATATGQQQQPYLYGSLGGPGFFLQPPELQPAVAAPPPVIQPQPQPISPPPPQLSEIERAWAIVKDSSSIAVLEAFRRQYGASNVLYDQLAAARIEELSKPWSAAGAAPPKPLVMPSPAPTPAPTPSPSPAPQPELARLLQTELQRVGCDPGGIDGVWGDNAENALERFARHAKLELRADEPTSAALEAVKGRQGRVCPLVCGQGTVEKNGVCVGRPAPTRAPAYGRNYGKNDHAADAARRPKREDTKK